MSMARHHLEWLALVPTSGPFLSVQTLLNALPQGLPEHDPERARRLRLAFDEWTDAQSARQPDRAIHTAWIRFVLTDLLGHDPSTLAEGPRIPESLKAEKPDVGATIRPTLALIAPTNTPRNLSLLDDDLLDEGDDEGDATPRGSTETPATPRLLISVYPPAQGLEKACRESGPWTASPATRMQALLAQTNVPLGLATNGDEWLLVHRATETTGFASFFAPLWQEEPLTLRAFRDLLGPRRFFGHESETLLHLLTVSADDHQEVTDQLGYQVRHAVETLVRAVDEIDRTRDGSLLRAVDARSLYEGALTLMMRLVFLLCAEERGLFPLADELYARNYAVSTLMATLREAADTHGEEVLERRFDAFSRLLAIFRVIFLGTEHDALRLPAYGGSLLDPTRFPWLDATGPFENSPLPIHNRTVLHLLEALQRLEVKTPGGDSKQTRPLSFRALDIEQIGHVYEGLLDHTAIRATEPILGLKGPRDSEPEIALATLETHAASGETTLLSFLKERTARGEKALATDRSTPATDLGKLLAACGGDESLLKRVLPFSGLLRRDSFHRFVVIDAGRFYVTQGSDRRSTGTHYTPRSLTEPVVRRTLEPIVYNDFASGTPASPETLRTADELLSLRVCDPACGSGAFLVETCRYLADRLCDAWARAESESPGAPLTIPGGVVSTGDPGERLVPGGDGDERRVLARRLIAARCLYGVDKNPQAVEIAKLSLWLVTMERDRPFHFLDHAIKCGDSLIGCVSREQLRAFSLAPDENDAQIPLDLFSSRVFDDAIELRRELESLPSETIAFIERKARLHERFEETMRRARLAADLIVAPALLPQKPAARQKKRAEFQNYFTAGKNGEFDDVLRAESLEILGELRPFHWALEFPEIVARGGFDAIIGNPPFMGGQKITGEFGVPYRDYLVANLAGGTRGSADIVAYFFLRASQLIRPGGAFGLIATNTIAQGDTREVGLDRMLTEGDRAIYAALPSMKWPGRANLEVAVAHVFAGDWAAPRFLDGRGVPKITAFLDDGSASGKPFRLAENAGKSFQGSIVLGMGFVLEPEAARELIARDPKNADVVFPYLNGEDLNSRPDQSPSRWVINFRDWPLRREEFGRVWASAGESEKKEWLRTGIVPPDYEGPVAADYPDCLEIVERLVKPERDKNNRDVYRLRWWHYAEKRPDLYATIADLPRVLACPIFTKHCLFVFLPKDYVYMNKMYIFPIAESWQFSLLSSNVHSCWAWTYSSTLKRDLQYTPNDCFETFPFPEMGGDVAAGLSAIGEAYHSHRSSVCLSRGLGLTKVYNLFHAADCVDADIVRLRELHADMDERVAGAYGWSDLSLSHGFHGVGKDARYTIAPDVRGEILRRLLALNHARFAVEDGEREEREKGQGERLKGGKRGAAAKAARAKTQHPTPDTRNSPAIDPAGGLFGGQTLLEMEP